MTLQITITWSRWSGMGEDVAAIVGGKSILPKTIAWPLRLLSFVLEIGFEFRGGRESWQTLDGLLYRQPRLLVGFVSIPCFHGDGDDGLGKAVQLDRFG